MRYQVNYEQCSIRPALEHQTAGVFDDYEEAKDELIEYWHNRRTEYAEMLNDARHNLEKARNMKEYGVIRATHQAQELAREPAEANPSHLFTMRSESLI